MLKQLLLLPFVLIFQILQSIFRSIVPPARKDVSGQICLITGAGSGIGQKMALEFAKLGCVVIGWDISKTGLEATHELLKRKQLGSKWRAYVCDVSSRTQIYDAANKVKSEIGHVDILVNNAGIVTGRTFLDCDDEAMIKTMEVNSMAHFWTLKAFLPNMLETNKGHVVSIASAAGFLGMPRMVDYCASKFAAVGLSEALDMELRSMRKTGVKTTIVCPFYIDTGMFHGVRSPLIPIIKTDDAVDAIIDSTLRDRLYCQIPFVTWLTIALKGLLPTASLFSIGEAASIIRSMETFQGRK